MSHFLHFITMLVIFSCACALRHVGLPRRFASSTASSSRLLAERINTQVELTSEKVVTTLNLKEGEKCVLCRCWKSKKFPYCDGAHAKHNSDTGDNLGPAIIVGVSVTK